MARQVFISTSSPDRCAAEAICAALEARGTLCWIAPRDVGAGMEWAEAIAAGIAEAAVLLLVHSVATGDSPMVRREVNLAVSAHRPVLPVRLDDSLPRAGLDFYLGSTHWFDAHPGPLQDHLPRLVARVEGLLAELGRPVAERPVVTVEVAFTDRPVVAVLPFRATGPDPVAEHVTDGIAGDLIAAISAWRVFPVISRNATLAYRGSDADPRAIGRALGARYIVSGSVRRRGTQLRVQVELVDAESGNVLLEEAFDREASAMEAMEDEIVLAICGVLAPEMERQERERAARRPRANPTALDLVRRGQWHRLRGSREDHDAAEALFAEALGLDGAHTRALAALSIARNFAAIRRWAEDPPATFQESLELARRAMQSDPRDAQGHYAFGLGLMNLGRRYEAMAALREAARLNPSHTGARANLGQLLNYLNRPEEALPELEVALRLSPQDAYRYQWLPYLAASHYLAGRYRDCLAAAEQALVLAPDYPLAVRYLVAALGQLGQGEAAAALLPLMRRIDGDIGRLEAMARRLFVREAADHILNGFRKAGFG